MTFPSISMTSDILIVGETYNLSDVFIYEPPEDFPKRIVSVSVLFYLASGVTFSGADVSRGHINGTPTKIYGYSMYQVESYLDIGSPWPPYQNGTITITKADARVSGNFGWLYEDMSAPNAYGYGNIYLGGTLNIVERLFTEGNDRVDFNALTDSQSDGLSIAGDIQKARGGNDRVTLPGQEVISSGIITWDDSLGFDAGAGNDHITGSARDDIIFGGTGDDKLYGGRGDDRLVADPDGTDIINGGEGNDTFAFNAARFAGMDQRAWFNLQKLNPENRDGGVDRTVEVAIAGRDTVNLEEMEVADFNGNEHSLVTVEIVIVRTADGRANGEVWFDGKLDEKLTDLWNHSDGVEGEGMWFDTLTPIDSGSYAGFYRYSGGLQRVIALEDWTGSEETILQDSPYSSAADIVRQFILIHSGDSNGKSEGCFLGSNLNAMPLFFRKLDALVQANDMELDAKGAVYFPIIPVTITVKDAVPGSVKQPKIVGTEGRVAEPASGESTGIMRFDVIEDVFAGVRGVADKFVQVFFKIASNSTATLDVDWEFASLASGRPTPPAIPIDPQSPDANWQPAHGTVWIERDARNPANDIYGVQIGTKGGSLMHSDVGVRLNIFADNKSDGGEVIAFQIVDFDLFTKASKGWKIYARSAEDNERDGRANEAENLLFEPGREVAQLTIRNTAPSVLALPDMTWAETGGATEMLWL